MLSEFRKKSGFDARALLDRHLATSGAPLPGEQAFCNDLHMSDEQVRELEAGGSDALQAITGVAPRMISYPHEASVTVGA